MAVVVIVALFYPFIFIYLFIHFIGGWVGIVVSISGYKGSFYHFQLDDTVEMRTKSVI